uniref:50S ribosomal protein L23 n=1 Tax=Nitzschia alba TaxID=2858 RepID=A0A5C0F2L4_NITAL|nr:50S ribosomal protein L23 [Nitzschia alba]QEI59596.1 50S ribosomal protein L23 [Nitzschia alba]
MNNFLNSNFSIVKSQIFPLKLWEYSHKTMIFEKKYCFLVDRYANKNKIKKILEYFFNISISKITTNSLPRKKKRIGKFFGYKSQYKKVIIRLKNKKSINFFLNN